MGSSRGKHFRWKRDHLFWSVGSKRQRLYCLEIRVLKDGGTLCFSTGGITKSEIGSAINMIFDVVIRLRNKRSNRGVGIWVKRLLYYVAERVDLLSPIGCARH